MVKAGKTHDSAVLPTLLIIEDDRIVTSRDGGQGWALFQFEPPDQLLLDTILPKMDGYEIARKSKTHADLKYIPILTVSGRAKPRDTAEIVADDIEALKEKIARCLQNE